MWVSQVTTESQHRLAMPLPLLGYDQIVMWQVFTIIWLSDLTSHSISAEFVEVNNSPLAAAVVTDHIRHCCTIAVDQIGTFLTAGLNERIYAIGIFIALTDVTLHSFRDIQKYCRAYKHTSSSREVIVRLITHWWLASSTYIPKIVTTCHSKSAIMKCDCVRTK